MGSKRDWTRGYPGDPAAVRRNTGSKLPCPIEGCGKPRSQGKIMCITCWWRVPTDLRLEVYATWRDYLQSTQPSRVTQGTKYPEALERYRKAKAAAIDAATPKGVHA